MGKEGTSSGSRRENDEGYIRRSVWWVVVVSFFPLYKMSSVVIHTNTFASGTSLPRHLLAPHHTHNT
jgi:hypothetical protein